MVAYQKALAIREKLVREHPEVLKYQNDLGASHNNLGVVYKDTGRWDEAVVAYQKALAIREKLVRVHAEVPQYQRDLACAHYNLARVYLKMGRTEEAETACQKVVRIEEPLARAHPEMDHNHRRVVYNNLAKMLSDKGRLKLYGVKVELLEKLAAEFPGKTQFTKDLATGHTELARTLKIAGRHRESQEARRRAHDLWKTLAAASPVELRYRRDPDHGIAPGLHRVYGGIAQQQRFSSLKPGTLLTLDPHSGVAASLAVPDSEPDSPIGLSGLAFSSRGELFASISSTVSETVLLPTLVQFDPDTGALLKTIGVIRTEEGDLVKLSDLAMQPGTDVLFGISSYHGPGHTLGAQLYTLDTSTAVATLVGSTGLEFGGGLAFAPDSTLYLGSFRGPLTPATERTVGLFTLDPKTGREIDFVELSDVAGNPSYRYVLVGLAIRPSDRTIFASGNLSDRSDGQEPAIDDISNLLVTIDPKTGFVTPVGPAGGGIGEKMGDMAFRPEKGEVASGK